MSADAFRRFTSITTRDEFEIFVAAYCGDTELAKKANLLYLSTGEVDETVLNYIDQSLEPLSKKTRSWVKTGFYDETE